MPSKTGFFMDFSDFDKGFKKILKKYPEYAAEGMHKKVGPRIINDSITVEPMAPHLWGELWKSQRILAPVIKGKEILFFVGFNIIYAAYQHEKLDVKDYTMAGSGPKFLEIKMQRFAAAYLKLVADYVDKKVRSTK